MNEIKNARIKDTRLGMAQGNILTFNIDLDYGGGGQGFGGYALDGPDGNNGRIGSAFGMEAIRRVLETVGVDRWEDLPGKHVRVVAEKPQGPPYRTHPEG